MNTLQYVGRHRTASFVDFACPRIRVENIAGAMIGDVLITTAVDDTTHNMLGINFGPDAIAALRDAIREPACICGASRSVRCAARNHRYSLAATS